MRRTLALTHCSTAKDSATTPMMHGPFDEPYWTALRDPRSRGTQCGTGAEMDGSNRVSAIDACYHSFFYRKVSPRLSAGKPRRQTPCPAAKEAP